ncbi:DUF1569 domain-containing protein [Chitinophaga barathri]|uniref:DUF1569 domain-containing protein n=1 Tax=Chitinophaga barathri TaxID=1647451 RepID=A0A3N4MMR2_9BACT|nr:DUF1569 domain-containing protein [Chitinophaga barathri]RPD40899.1 DUF1569 domain-containing protein [Chitinophaga barathri]
MKTIFDTETRTQLTGRIQSLSPDNKALWGKMTAFQMLRHCNKSEELFLGMKTYKRLFIGRLFGKMALGSILKDDSPMKKNQPTHPEFRITGDGDFEAEKEKWIGLLQRYDHTTAREFVHPFFGRMSPEQIGQYVFKHTDHHLRQFNH